jgi:PAS domain S-box-containing protein
LAAEYLELQRFIEHAPAAVAMFDRDMRYLAASRRWLSDHRSGVEVSGRSHYDVFPDIPRRWRELHCRALAGEVLAKEGDRFDRADGTVQWLNWEMRPWHNADGGIGGIVISMEEISERKRSEEALQQSREDFARAQEVGQIGWWRLDTRQNILSWSDETYRIFGQPKGGSLTYETFMEAVHPDDRDFVNARWKASIRGEPYDIEHRIVVSEQVKWVREKAYLEFDETGALLGGFGVVQDISEQKKAQQQLIEAQSRLQAIMSAVPVGISYSDGPRCEHITGNPALLAQFEIALGENVSASARDPAAPGRRVRYFRDGHEIADYELPLQRAIAERRAIPREEFEVLLPSGRRWFMDASAAPVLGELGETIGGVAVTVDTTERRRTEQALREAGRRKDEFLATLAHELRNPLAPIRNAVSVLQRLDDHDPDAKNRARSLIAIVERQAKHLIRLVDDLLEVSRISRGKVELKKERRDLAGIIRHAVETSQPHIQAAGQRLTIELPSSPVILDADPVRLAQVFANLLNNAAKYTENGGSIWLKAERSGDEVIVSVRDSGMGISAEMLPRVFDLFTQSSHALGRAQGGLGIGLALARSLVHLHGGQIQAWSEGPGHGSELTVRLPPCEARSGDAESEGSAAAAPALSRRVLVVDDDQDVANSLALLLNCLGMDVRIAYGGAAALTAVAEFKPCLAFVDIGMPGMDGYETARRIRKLPEGQDLILVALSGWARDDDRRRSREAGFDHHFVKPIEVDALENLLAPAPVGA